MTLRRVRSALLLLSLSGLALLPCAIPAQAQQSTENRRPGAVAPAPEPARPSRSDPHADGPVVEAAPLDTEINIDGLLDEPGWQRATPSGGTFTQIDPSEGDPSPEMTDVYVLYDTDAIYIGARLWDSSGEIRQRLGRRDSRAQDSDWFTVAMDTHHDHQNAYQFSLNPAGVKRDEIGNGGFRGDDSWDAVWDGTASVDAEGWSVEIRVPFSQLRFSSEPVQTWGIQFTRSINRLQETSVFVFTPRRERGGVARFGHLSGLNDLETGKRLEVVPYALGRGLFVQGTAGDPFRDASEFQRGTGLDALYRVTTSMTLTGTVNPDFGQVEVDPAVINLSAFETSFQENRPFFVEGGNLFRFGSAGGGGGFRGRGGGGRGGGGGGGGFFGGAPPLLYSRRIGRPPQGSLPSEAVFSDEAETVIILGAAKLTGRTANGWSVGLLDALTGEETAQWLGEDDVSGSAPIEPRTNYFAGRVIKSLRSGQTQIGAIGTAVNRSLGDPDLASRLHSSAYTGGLDFSHEFLSRAWSLEGFFAFSQVSGSTDALIRTQRRSSRYYQRPDAGHVQVDSSRTVLRDYSARIELAKRAGLHWRGDVNAYTTGPGFEINDLGFQTGVDRMGTRVNFRYEQNTPQGWFRNYRIYAGPNFNWNHDGDFVGGRVGMGANGQFKNFWRAGLNINKGPAGYDDRLTRGGPLVRSLSSQSIAVNVQSDNRRRVAGFLFGNYSWGEGQGIDRHLGLNIQIRPVDNWTISFGPNVSRSLVKTQYLTSVSDEIATAMFGRRYIFSELKRTQISMETRLNVTFTPDLSLELFVQPLLSSGDYSRVKELREARKYGFDEYGVDKGTISFNAADDDFDIDPDGAGPAGSFTVDNKDFNTRSLRGNAVLRWEYRPGSTLFLVWQQNRSGTEDFGDFQFGRDAGSIFDAPGDNVFAIKFDYWLNL